MITDSYWDYTIGNEIFLEEMVSVPPYIDDKVIEAMEVLRKSQWLIEELENVNYHGFSSCLDELIYRAKAEKKLERRLND